MTWEEFVQKLKNNNVSIVEHQGEKMVVFAAVVNGRREHTTEYKLKPTDEVDPRDITRILKIFKINETEFHS